MNRKIIIANFYSFFFFLSGTGRAENGGSSLDQSTGGGGHGTGDSQDERVVFVNAPHQPATYRNNHISTAKYSLLSFIPSFLFEQFRRYSNCFFLFIALMQVCFFLRNRNLFYFFTNEAKFNVFFFFIVIANPRCFTNGAIHDTRPAHIHPQCVGA